MTVINITKTMIVIIKYIKKKLIRSIHAHA
jgi:hypothetical protein